MKLFLAVCIGAALAAVASFAYAGENCTSEGVRMGVVQKFSYKGMVNKSWEGELVMEGVRSTETKSSTKITNVWKFSTLDANVAKQIDDAMMNPKSPQVVLKYCQVFTAMGQTDTPYHVTKVVVKE